MFDDEHFWNMADDDDVGWPDKGVHGRRKSRSRSVVHRPPDANNAPMSKDSHLNPAFVP